MTKLRLLGVVGLLLTTAPAFAADLTHYEPVSVTSPSSAFDWSGFYVGVNGGYAGGTFEHPLDVDVDLLETTLDAVSGTLDVTAGGFVGGVQAGYNADLGGFVLGIEGDIQASNVDGRVSISGVDEAGVIGDAGDTLNVDAGTSLDYFGTLRARAGATIGNALIYATAGLAYGHTTSSINASINGVDLLDDALTSKNDRWGYSVGAGIEYALADNVTFKTEYLYTDLGSENLYTGPIFFEDTAMTLDSTVAFHTVRAGLNFQF
jgi:outer membrane immunogenic protein